MAQKLSKDQLSVVNRVIDVLDNIGGVNVDPVIEMAVFGCSELLRQTLAPPAKWTAAMVKEVLTTKAPLTTTETDPPTQPIRAHAHAAAVKAAATRKANKAKAAGNGNLADVAGTVENDAAGSDQTE